MRYIWLVFLGLAAIIGVVSRAKRSAAVPFSEAATTTPATLVVAEMPAPALSSSTSKRLTLSQALLPGTNSAGAAATSGPVADSLVRFALRQLGVPYRWAGITPESGFDCSGFLLYAYAHVGVGVPHSTALLIGTGQPVPRAEARPGDLVVFTGTAPGSTTPGHAGIIISRAGEGPLRFVHASSARRESGVKISQVEGTDYERRFMQVRRVLGVGQLASAPAAGQPTSNPPSQPVRIGAVLSRVETRPAAVQVADDVEPAPPPPRLAPLARQTAAPRQATKPAASRAKAKLPAKKALVQTRATAASRRAPVSKAGLKQVAKPVVKAPAKTSRKARLKPVSAPKKR